MFMTRTEILHAIQELPADEQEHLLDDLLDLMPVAKEPPAMPHTSHLAGIFNTGTKPPTDEDVTRWLEEHRLEKYGNA
jgi:hypothetical protein